MMIAAADEMGEVNPVELGDQAVSFVIGGQDTSSISLSWSIYFMCTVPRCYDRLMEEIRELYVPGKPLEAEKRACPCPPPLPPPSDLHPALPVCLFALHVMLIMCFHPQSKSSCTWRPSSRRCHGIGPPALPSCGKPWRTSSSRGTRSPKGFAPFPCFSFLCPRRETALISPASRQQTAISIPVNAPNFHPDLWGDDVNEFKPERFLDPERKVPLFSLLTFSGGPRRCIGERFSMIEQKVLLIRLLHRLRPRCHNTEDPFTLPAFTLRTRDGEPLPPPFFLVPLPPRFFSSSCCVLRAPAGGDTQCKRAGIKVSFDKVQ